MVSRGTEPVPSNFVILIFKLLTDFLQLNSVFYWHTFNPNTDPEPWNYPPPNFIHFFNSGLWLYRTSYSKDIWTSEKYDRLPQQQL